MLCQICQAESEEDMCELHCQALKEYIDELKSHAMPSLYYELIRRWICRQAERYQHGGKT